MAKKTDLAKFRKKIQALKKQGLVTARPVNRIYPGTKEGAKLKREIQKYDDILSGKATAVKVPRSKLQSLKRSVSGAEVHHGKLIVPHNLGERAYYDKKHGGIGVDLGPGVTEVNIPARTGPAFAKQLDELPDLGDTNEFYGFKFFGHDGIQYFRTGGLMRRYLSEYTGRNDLGAFQPGANVIGGIRIMKITYAEMQRREERFRR